jgi:hypothetical protein
MATVELLHAGARADAGTIAISTDVSATVTASGISIALKITNSGDEPARSVVPSVTLAGATSRAQEASTLAPGQRVDVPLEVPWKEKRSGQWPITTSVDYADGNGYPFQAVQVALITLGAPAPSLIALIGVEGPPVTMSADLHVRLKSLSGTAQQVHLRAVAPRGLEVGTLPTLSLEPWADRESLIPLTNRGVLPGSSLPVFVVAEYEDQDGHHASVAHRMIEVRYPPPSAAVTRPYYAFVAAGILIALWFGMYLRRRKAHAK